MKDNSVRTSVSVIVAAVIGLSLGAVQQAAARGCDKTDSKCMEVEFPGDTGRPKVPKEPLRVSKSEGKFAFGYNPSDFRKAYVIFKCQDETSYPHECRTPVKGGEWIVELTGDGPEKGKAKSIEINDTLERCDLCAEVDHDEDYKQCVKNACHYPYMIVDRNGKRPPLDPIVIVDPE